MLPLCRAPRLARSLPRINARCFAIVQGSVPTLPQTEGDGSNSQLGESKLKEGHRIAVDPNHGLWHFFRKKAVDGAVRYETVEPPDLTITGRSWTAAELRRKSFSDLHTLWYVVLRERNLLATQKEEARRLGVTNPRAFTSLSKVYQCRKTMARIKGVLNERRLAYEGAVNIVTKQQDEEEAKAASSIEESHGIQTDKGKKRMVALEKLRHADAYRHRKGQGRISGASTAETNREVRKESKDLRPSVPAPGSPATSVAASLFSSDPPDRP